MKYQTRRDGGSEASTRQDRQTTTHAHIMETRPLLPPAPSASCIRSITAWSTGHIYLSRRAAEDTPELASDGGRLK